MAEMLASSLLWRVLLAIGGWFSALAHSSRIFAWLGRTWRASKTRAWLLRRLSASDAPDARELEREALCAAERAACRAARPEGLSGRFGSLPHLALFRSLRPEQPSVFVAVL